MRWGRKLQARLTVTRWRLQAFAGEIGAASGRTSRNPLVGWREAGSSLECGSISRRGFGSIVTGAFASDARSSGLEKQKRQESPKPVLWVPKAMVVVTTITR